MDRVLRQIALAALTTATGFGIATATDQLATPVVAAGPAYVFGDDAGWDGGDDASWDDDDWDDD